MKVVHRIGVEEERGTATKPAKVKAEAGIDDSFINITVRSQTTTDEFFLVRHDVKLERLINMYCRKYSLDPRAVQFLAPSGRHIFSVQTPDELGIEDGDEISVNLYQLGGAGAPLHASQSSA